MTNYEQIVFKITITGIAGLIVMMTVLIPVVIYTRLAGVCL